MKTVQEILVNKLVRLHDYDDVGGIFFVNRLSGILRVMFAANPEDAWEHVSVSLQDRCPTWAEMCLVKDICFWPTETVFQLHPPEADHINVHPFVLHMWRNPHFPVAMPPKEYV